MKNSVIIAVMLLAANFAHTAEEINEKDVLASLRRKVLEATHVEATRNMTDEQILQTLTVTLNGFNAQKNQIVETNKFNAEVSKKLTQISGELDKIQKKS